MLTSNTQVTVWRAVKFSKLSMNHKNSTPNINKTSLQIGPLPFLFFQSSPTVSFPIIHLT